MPAGIDPRHSKRCTFRESGRCDCSPTFQASVFDVRTGRKIRKTFPAKGAAKAWRQDMLVAVRRGEIAPAPEHAVTVDAAVKAWLEAARTGTVRTRGRKPFAPATIRSVEQTFRKHAAAKFGKRRLERVTLLDLQDWVDGLSAAGVNASTIETAVLPLRLVYRRAKGRGEVTIDPTDGLELPEKPMHGSARQPPAPEQLHRLLDAAPSEDRAAWATFMLCGLRRGELLALRWENLDLKAGTLRVEGSHDPSSGPRPPKSRRGVRTIPVGQTLSDLLREHRLRSGRREGPVFGDGETPLATRGLQERADAAWASVGLERVTPHVCRHLYASVMAAAGVPPHVLSRYMGHSSIAVTFDRYQHLFPGEEAAAATLQETYLAGVLARGVARGA